MSIGGLFESAVTGTENRQHDYENVVGKEVKDTTHT